MRYNMPYRSIWTYPSEERISVIEPKAIFSKKSYFDVVSGNRSLKIRLSFTFVIIS